MTEYHQSFPYVAGVELGKRQRLEIGDSCIFAPARTGCHWVSLQMRELDGKLLLLVSDLTASELNHDDYSSGLAKGRIAIALQGTPDGDNPHGQFARFEGVRWKASRHEMPEPKH